MGQAFSLPDWSKSVMRKDDGHLRAIVTRNVTFWLILWLAVPAYGAESIVGSVKTVHGSVFVRRGAEKLPCREGVHLLPQDILQTSADSSVGVIFQDGTRIALGPNTELKIDQFVYQPGEGKFGLLVRLARGVMAYISGKIAKFSPESVRVETPVGIVGLRGTELAISLEEK